MEANTYISIWGYLVFVTDGSIDVYEKWETFQRHGIARNEPLGERKEIFIETLLNGNLVNNVNDAEVVSNDIDSYFGWFFMRTDPKAELVPSPDDMIRLRQAIGDTQFDDMSVYDRELFATGYKSPMITDVDFDRQTYFRWLGDHKAGTFEQKKTGLFKSWFKRNQDMATEQQGYAVQNVFSQDPKDKWASYSYTYGAHDKLGYEVVIVNAGRDSGGILSSLVSKVIDQGGFKLGEVFDVDGFKIGGVACRARADEIPLDSPTAQNMLGAKNLDMKRAVQIYIGDAANVLPGEPGYDETFVQILTVDESNEQGN